MADDNDQINSTPTLDLIKHFEGFAPEAKWDYKQYSNGYGTKATYPGEPIDKDEAHRRLVAATSGVDSWLNQNISTPLSDARRAALTSFGHNLGTGALDNLAPDINNGDWDTVARRMLQYNRAGGEVNDALVNRRGIESSIVANNDLAAGPPSFPQLMSQYQNHVASMRQKYGGNGQQAGGEEQGGPPQMDPRSAMLMASLKSPTVPANTPPGGQPGSMPPYASAGAQSLNPATMNYLRMIMATQPTMPQGGSA